MTQLCGRWYGKELSEPEVLGLARVVNARWANPLPPKELDDIVRSVKATHDRKHPQPEEKPRRGFLPFQIFLNSHLHPT